MPRGADPYRERILQDHERRRVERCIARQSPDPARDLRGALVGGMRRDAAHVEEPATVDDDGRTPHERFGQRVGECRRRFRVPGECRGDDEEEGQTERPEERQRAHGRDYLSVPYSACRIVPG
jgi:hypothetical protein